MARYHLYVDDSGNREYDDNRNYKTSGKSLYFVYGAILIEKGLRCIVTDSQSSAS